MKALPCHGPESRYGQFRLSLPPLAVMLIITIASWGGGTPSSPEIPYFDKVAHVGVFGLIGTLLFRRIRCPFASTRRWLIAGCGVIAFGLLDESLQFFNPARSFDPMDWIADLSGATLAIALYRNWSVYRNVLEFPLFARLALSKSANSNPAP